ncbi:MAG: redoxin domain-containing protein [Bacteroidetes bacterium]|nr:redoxin domain-containing protein [Bacteroidota bacterium]
MFKNFMLLTGCLFLGLGLFAQKTKITGTAKYKEPVKKVFLNYRENDKTITDSAELKNGTFSFSGNLTQPTLATIMVRFDPKDSAIRKPEYRQFYFEPGNIHITIKDSIKNAVVKGSKSEIEFEKLQKKMEPFTVKMNDLNTQYMDFRKNKDEAGMQKIASEFDVLDSTINEDVYHKYFVENSKSPVALYALERFAGYAIDPAKVEPLYNKLSPVVKNTPSGKAYKKRIETAKKTAVGAYAINFTQNDTLEKPVSLSNFKGKYVLLDFWASWCGPCRAENPNVVKAFNQYKDKNFTVLGVSLDQPGKKQAWLDAIHKDNLTWTHVSDLKFWDNAVAKEYGIQAIPQNFLIDPSGKIIAKNVRGEELDKKLAEVIK